MERIVPLISCAPRPYCRFQEIGAVVGRGKPDKPRFCLFL